MTDDATNAGRTTGDAGRSDDTELLRRYVAEQSQAAFGELVRRHIDFVYASALRQTRGNAALAQDVAQAVFTDLARKAGGLARHEVFVGWLHPATRFAAGTAIRPEVRYDTVIGGSSSVKPFNVNSTGNGTKTSQVTFAVDFILGF